MDVFAGGGPKGRRSHLARPDGSALPVPAPDGGVVTHRDQNAAVAAEAGLSDG